MRVANHARELQLHNPVNAAIASFLVFSFVDPLSGQKAVDKSAPSAPTGQPPVLSVKGPFPRHRASAGEPDRYSRFGADRRSGKRTSAARDAIIGGCAWPQQGPTLLGFLGRAEWCETSERLLRTL